MCVCVREREREESRLQTEGMEEMEGAGDNRKEGQAGMGHARNHAETYRFDSGQGPTDRCPTGPSRGRPELAPAAGGTAAGGQSEQGGRQRKGEGGTWAGQASSFRTQPWPGNTPRHGPQQQALWRVDESMIGGPAINAPKSLFWKTCCSSLLFLCCSCWRGREKEVANHCNP